MKKILCSLLLGLTGHYGYSQLDNSLLYTPNDDSLIKKEAKFGFLVNSIGYVRNTEYHSSIDVGATWAGNQIWPQAIYRFNNKLSFKAGLFLQKDIGNNTFRPLIPTYTVSFKIKDLKVNFGTLDGSLDHNLIEPLYAMENFIDKRIENGLQFKGKKKRLDYDVWLDWEKMIYRTSTSQEQFTVGVSTDFKLIKKENLSWSFPIQLMARHKGGEIYTQPHSNIKSQYNFAYGTHLTLKRPGKIIDKVDLQGYLTFYEDGAPSKADSFMDGRGNYMALTLGKKNFGVMLNYWDAHQYIAPLGEALLVSKSRGRPGEFIQYRKAVMVRLMYEIPLWNNHGSLVARMNNNYDLAEKKYNNVVEIYFKFNIGTSPKKFNTLRI